MVLFVSNIWYHLWQMPGNLLRGTLRSIKINRKILSFNIRLFKIWDVFFFPRWQYNALTVKCSVFSFFSIGLVSFKFIEPIIGDLQDPATIYHTVWWLKVAMRFYLCTVKITHSLKKVKNTLKIPSHYFKNSLFCSHKYIPKKHLVTLTMSVTSDVTNMLSSFTSSFSTISWRETIEKEEHDLWMGT